MREEAAKEVRDANGGQIPRHHRIVLVPNDPDPEEA